MKIKVIDLYKDEFDKAYLRLIKIIEREYHYLVKLESLNGYPMLDIFEKKIMEKFRKVLRLII